jgi:hypothetical protein
VTELVAGRAMQVNSRDYPPTTRCLPWPAHEAHWMLTNHRQAVPGRRLLGTETAEAQRIDVCHDVSSALASNGSGQRLLRASGRATGHDDAPGDWDRPRRREDICSAQRLGKRGGRGLALTQRSGHKQPKGRRRCGTGSVRDLGAAEERRRAALGWADRCEGQRGYGWML